MEEVKLTKAQEILFEVYDKGVQNQDCDLDEYVEKMKQALNILDVVGQNEQFKCHSCGTNHSGKNDDQLFEVCKECFNGI